MFKDPRPSCVTNLKPLQRFNLEVQISRCSKSLLAYGSLPLLKPIMQGTLCVEIMIISSLIKCELRL